MPKPPSLFVAIACYRDTEAQHTMRDAYRMARFPERVSVGICWQYVPGHDDEMFALATNPWSVRHVAYDARQSRGACWAKRQALDLRDNEPYVLHIDSHMRFHPGWDVGLIEQLAACDSPRPILSAYPAPYQPPKDGHCQTPRMTASRFDESGVLILGATDLPAPEVPERGAYLAGGFIFSRAAFWDDVPYDPDLYFQGEEVTLSARAFTHGWDVHRPSVCLIHHQYDRVSAVRHWDDHTDWTRRNDRSAARVRAMLARERPSDPSVVAGFERYGLGTRRTLDDFERFTGVDFRNRRLLPGATTGPFPTRGA